MNELGRREFLGLLGVFLGGCAFQSSLKFSESDYCFLREEFMKRGLHNLDSSLFDFGDKEVRAAYEKTKTTPGLIIESDLIGKLNIENAVGRHLQKYRGRNLILISGAGFHIYGSVRTFEEKFDTEYISITPRKLDFHDVIEDSKNLGIQNPQELVEKARKTLENQLRRANGVVRHYGYENIIAFVRRVSSSGEARNIAVGIEETGMHGLYGIMKGVYEVLNIFIEIFAPPSILYLRENMHFSEDSSRKEFLEKARKLGIPVKFENF